jgi:superfamily I DNA and/or RNA helicase
VNYFEAQAVVRKLEELYAAAETPGQVGVLALYPAQAELIRQLVRRNPKLSSAAAALHIDVPAAFRQRECDVAVVSLTRSHGHRAVPFGDGPAALLLALTRARRRLVLVGDPGTLARRVDWRGALDHLDEAAAATEARLLGQVLRYVQGQGRHADAFQLSEGGGV